MLSRQWRHWNMIEAFFHVVCVALRQSIMTSLGKQFTNSQILSIMKREKLGTNVYFTNSLNHWPQRHCDKKASIETTREQSIIVTSQLPVVGSWVDDATLGQHFEIFGSSNGVKCWFMSLKAHESHKWSVHRIHGSEMFAVLFNEHQALRFQRRFFIIIVVIHKIISRSVSGIATDSPCGVLGRGWTTCLQCSDPILGLFF